LEKIIAFTDYDIFAYLMVGIAILAASDLVLDTRFFFRKDWGFGIGIVIVVVAYIVGQVLSTPADWVMEQLLVKEWLKEPSYHLVVSNEEYERYGKPPANKFFESCKASNEEGFLKHILASTLSSYGEHLSCGLQDNIRKKTNKEGKELFFEAYAVAKKEKDAAERMLVFSRLYIFSRNMAFAAFLAALAVIFRIGKNVSTERKAKLARTETVLSTVLRVMKTALPQTGSPTKLKISEWLRKPGWQLVIFLVLGFGLLYRYLFFYRLYDIEVLIAFASAKPAG
jgi:hypothetical protein